MTGSFAALQHKLETEKRKDKLNSFLTSRPDRVDLVKRNILKTDAHAIADEKERIAVAKVVLGDLMAARPNPEQLVQQKIITDIGDLPSGLEKKVENQLTPQKITAGGIEKEKIIQVSLGFAHSFALDGLCTYFTKFFHIFLYNYLPTRCDHIYFCMIANILFFLFDSILIM